MKHSPIQLTHLAVAIALGLSGTQTLHAQDIVITPETGQSVIIRDGNTSVRLEVTGTGQIRMVLPDGGSDPDRLVCYDLATGQLAHCSTDGLIGPRGPTGPAGGLAFNVKLNGTDITDPSLDLVVMGSHSGRTQFLTNSNYRLTVIGTQLKPRTVYFSEPDCTGDAGADVDEIGKFEGELFANGGSVFYVPLSASIDSDFNFNSLRGTDGNCSDTSGSTPVFPVEPNAPTTTGIAIADPSSLTLEFQRLP